MPDNWVRSIAGKGPQCPICGHKGGCILSTDGEAVICIRVEEGCAKRGDGTPIKADKGMGWLHRLNGTQNPEPYKTNGVKPLIKPQSVPYDEWQRRQEVLTSSIRPEKLELLSKELGVSVRSLNSYGVGFHIATQAWSFPMYDGTRDRKGNFNIVGMRLRGYNGFKYAMPGSSNGIFIPNDYILPDMADPPLLLMLPEGPTDAMAARDLGFRAVGRPNALGGMTELRNLIAIGQRQHIIIVADRDETKWLKDKEGKPTTPYWPGYEGAVALAKSISRYAQSIRIIQPPKGVKDLRQWVKDYGGSAFLMQAMVLDAPVLDKQAVDKIDEEIKLWRTNLTPPA